MFDLTGKVALITGAKQGMGKSHAVYLAKQGAKVVITDVDSGECELVGEEITKDGGEVLCFKMDVTSKKEIDEVFDQVIEKFGRLDILVNNAGIYVNKSATDMTEEEWDETLNINLKGQFLCAQRAALEMQKSGGGRIINIASIASGGVGVGILNAAHYTASKGGVIGMTETLAVEWAEHGITVNVIAPGAIDTPMLTDAGIEGDAMEQLMAGIPLKRIGKSEEVSSMVVYLASNESSYVTGATFYVDGGWLAA